MEEDNPLWCQVVRSIRGKDSHNWHGKNGNSLRSPWISIPRISFWSDPWDGVVTLSSSYPRLYKVALLPKGVGGRLLG